MLMLLWSAILSISFSLPTKEQRLSLAEWGSYNYRDHKGPGTYAFGYDIEDAFTNNIQFRQEERHLNGSVTGSYGYVQPNGKALITHYIADASGYRVYEENVPPIHSSKPQDITRPPLQQEDEQIFEGEFHPVNEDLDNDLDYNDNPHPILFPTQLHKPSSYTLSKIIPQTLILNKPKTLTASRGKYYSAVSNPLITYYDPSGRNRGHVKFRVY